MKVAGAAKPIPPARRRTHLAARSGGPGSRRGSLPETPLLKWKTDEKARNRSVLPVEDDGDDVGSRSEGRRWREGGFSARKIAAGMWLLQAPEDGGGACQGDGSRTGKGGPTDMISPVVCHRNHKLHNVEEKDALDSPHSISSMTKGFLFKLEPSFQLSSSAMEDTTKWDPDPVSFKAPDDVNQIHSRKKLLDHQVNAVSMIPALESELNEARSRISELEMECRSSNKKLEHFLKKVSEGKAMWRRREHEKIRAFLDDIKSDLSREKKNRQRMEILNSKLVDELAEAKLLVKQLMQEYEKERKTRALVEEVCDELAKEIGDDKAEVEVLKMETTRLREEVDEERKMLQMAEVWREERVQMKLLDAKVALEEKNSQLNKLVANLKRFCLRSRNVTQEMKDIREAELLIKAASSVNIQDLKEFVYEPSNPDDILAVLEEVAFGGNHARQNEQCVAYSPASHSSKIRTVSPEVNGIVKDDGDISRHQMGSMNCNGDVEEDGSGWETMSSLEDQGSSYSLESVNGCLRKNDALGGEPPRTEIVCSIPIKRPKKVSSIVRLWKSNVENCKLVSGEVMNGRFSNGSVGPPEHVSGKGGFSPSDVVGWWSPPETGNAQITRGTKGCIEWPRGPYKSGLKAKLLAARMESQKIQLKHVLKQKM